MSFKFWSATNLQRYSIEFDEYVTIVRGFVMVVDAYPVLRVQGILRLDGVIKFGSTNV